MASCDALVVMASSEYAPLDGDGRSRRYHATVLDIGRSGFAVGKELKRQLTKYLNECRNREDDHGSEGDATIKLKSSMKMKSSPPVPPNPDYASCAGSVTDGSEHSEQEEGWDTDFDDDMDEDKHKSELQEETAATAAAAAAASHSNGVQGSMISSIINQLKTRTNSDNQSAQITKNACQRSGPSSSINQSNFVRDDRGEVESSLQAKPSISRRQMPRPPKHPVVLPNKNMHHQRSNRPLQNPPPPPRQSPTVQEQHHEFVSDNYEVPTPALSEAGSPTDVGGSSSRNSLALSSRSASPGKSEFSSQQDVEREMVITDDELAMRTDCGISDDRAWQSSSASIRSTSSDLPELPPKNVAGRYAPPPLPKKPKGKTKQFTSSDDAKNKAQKCTTKVANLFSTIKMPNRKTSNEKKSNTCGAKERLEASHHDFSSSPTPHMTKSSSMSSLTRPLPPVPNKNGRQHRASAMITSLQSTPHLALLRGAAEHPLEIQPWFHRVEREVAEGLLRNLAQSGSYLVRESKRAGESSPYTVTIFYDDKISHLNIRMRSDGKYALGKEKDNEKPFNSVEELIAYHQQEPILLTAKNQAIGKTILLHHPPKNTF